MENKKYNCPCCGFKTLDGKNSYDICPVCFWEDDPYQNDNPYFEGGANKVSLIKAKENYKSFGASEKKWIKKVRKPTEEEKLNQYK